MVLHPAFYLRPVCRTPVFPVAQQPFGSFRMHSTMRRADHLDCLNVYPTKLAV